MTEFDTYQGASTISRKTLDFSIVKVKVILRLTVSKSVLVSGPHLGPATNFSHSLFDYFLDSFGFVDVGRPI
jgi:hypothetical protein